MEAIVEALGNAASLPIEHLIGFIALAAIGLAAFAIYTVSSIVKKERRRDGP